MNIKATASILFFCWVSYCFCKIDGNKKDVSSFVMSSKTINYILEQKRVIEIEEKFLPEDITFACADIKYADGKLMFCELGEAIYMPLRLMPVMIKGQQQQIVAPCWEIFWRYLKQFKLQMLLVGDIDSKSVGALDQLYLLPMLVAVIEWCKHKITPERR